MTKLAISPDLKLPADTVTSTLVVYGGKGMGKTNLGSVLVEELAAAGYRFSVLDPMGVWWGLRHSADGKGPGIEVLILGGVHGDIPIEPTAGAVVADLVVDEDANVVIDISRRPDGSMWSIGERIRFVTDYVKRLYQRQGEKRRALMQLIDEVARFAPQTVRKGEEAVAACMGAVAVLVEEGRNVGLGCAMFTQRSARLNKDVAELADCMIAFRTPGPNSRRAVLDWLGEHVEKERLKEFDQKVRALPQGHALVVSPGWLEFEGIVPMRMRQTFDSSATPKPGERQRRTSGPGAKPDLEKYRERMAETIERVKAEDPRALKKRVADLQAELARAQKAKPAAAPAPARRIEVPVIKDGQVKRLEDALGRLERVSAGGVRFAEDLSGAWGKVRELAVGLAEGLSAATRPGSTSPPRANPFDPPAPKPAPAPRPRRDPPPVDVDAGELSVYAQGLLRTIAQRHPMKLTFGQLAALAGRSSRSSVFDGAVAKLRKAGMIERGGRHAILTEAGRAAVGAVDGMPTTPAELQAAWLRVLPDYEAALLRAALEFGGPLAIEQLAEGAGKSRTSSVFDGAVASLKRNGLLEVRDGLVHLSDEITGGA